MDDWDERDERDGRDVRRAWADGGRRTQRAGALFFLVGLLLMGGLIAHATIAPLPARSGEHGPLAAVSPVVSPTTTVPSRTPLANPTPSPAPTATLTPTLTPTATPTASPTPMPTVSPTPVSLPLTFTCASAAWSGSGDTYRGSLCASAPANATFVAAITLSCAAGPTGQSVSGQMDATGHWYLRRWSFLAACPAPFTVTLTARGGDPASGRAVAGHITFTVPAA